MLRNIDMNKLKAVKKRSPDAARIIDTLIENHKLIVGAIGHEIRNPLSCLYSSLQIIEQQHPEVKEFKFWKESMQDAADMRTMLNDLTTFNNSNTLRLERVRLAPFFRNIAISFSIAMEHSGIYFWSDIPERLPAIDADRLKLEQVFYNLLRNAKDAVYAHYFGAPCEISLTVKRAVVDGYRVVIAEVRDNGIGIPPDELEAIFEPFRTFKTNGSGLGLPICRNILECHKSTITVESVVKEWTVFRVTIPV